MKGFSILALTVASFVTGSFVQRYVILSDQSLLSKDLTFWAANFTNKNVPRATSSSAPPAKKVVTQLAAAQEVTTAVLDLKASVLAVKEFDNELRKVVAFIHEEKAEEMGESGLQEIITKINSESQSILDDLQSRLTSATSQSDVAIIIQDFDTFAGEFFTKIEDRYMQ